jgi:phosphatidylserine synthase
MLSYARDLPNLCSLAGLLCALLGIYFALLHVYPAAMISILWAVLFDWWDGLIARRMKNRSDEQGALGAQLDSLIDVVSFSVFPAILLLSYGQFNAWFLPGAFIVLATGVIRLSYFNVFGLVDKSTYMGLALDNNVIILAAVFLLDGILSQFAFAAILYTLLIVLAILNIAPIRTPKFGGRWIYILVLYVAILTAVYSCRLFH